MDLLDDLVKDIVQGDYLMVVSLILLTVYGCWRLWLQSRTRPALVNSRLRRFFGLVWQIGLALLLERLYEFSRAHVAIEQVTAIAYSHGYHLLDFELRHGLFVEERLEHLFLPHGTLMHAILGFYAFAHLFATLGFLIWVYVRRSGSFPFVRNLFYLTTGIALIIYILYPTAPPRMFLNFGFVDPSQTLGFTAAGGAQLTSYTYNPFAAMPSLHLVYAVIIGASLVAIGRHLWLRALGVLYPLLMLAVILISANHWLLDAAGAIVLVAGAALLLVAAGRVSRLLQHRLTARQPSHIVST
jgi:hypothetical protein